MANTNSETKVINIGSRKQLLIDYKFIEDHKNITLCMNPPVKAEPVFGAEASWEEESIVFASIVHKNGEYRIYYLARFHVEESLSQAMNVKLATKDETAGALCFAVSEDGLCWRRPRVGRFDMFGGKDNNVVMPGAGEGAVFVDPNETDGFSYWYFGRLCENPWWDGAKGCSDTWFPIEGALYLARSRDGLDWERVPGHALPFLCDTHNQAFFDVRLRQYVFYVRGWEFPSSVGGYGRVVCRGQTDRLLKLPWPFKANSQRETGPRGMYGAVHGELPIVMRCDKQDPPVTDLYNPCVHQYTEADQVYVAFPSPYRHYDANFNSYGRDERGHGENRDNQGPLDIACAVSRDGVEWNRFRRPYVPLGLVGAEDGGHLYMVLGMVIKDNEIWQYCASSAVVHGRRTRHCAIIRLVQRLDGFVSADAGPEGGELTTPPLVFDGNRLELNIDCSAMGEAWVEMLDQHGKKPIQGYAMDDAVSVDRNGVAQEVWWKNGPDVSPLIGRSVRLRIKMRSAKLYAFQFVAK